MKPQCASILRYMEENGSITDLDAYSVLRIRRLAARIHDLRHIYGIDIQAQRESGTNAEGVPVNYARYFIKKGDAKCR